MTDKRTQDNAAASKARILIVEDEAIIVEDLALQLERLHYEVTGVADSGEKALALVANARPDIVLMDIRLKGAVDGIQVADTIRQQHRLPVIYLTAHSDEDTLKRAKVTDPFGYILKPYDERDLKSHIEMALWKHQAAQRLRESEERFQSLFQGSPDAIFGLNRAGRFVLSNPACATISGYSAEELSRMTFRDLCTEDSQASAGAAFEKGLAGEPANLAIAIHSKQGKRVELEVTSSPMVVDNQNQGVFGVARDVTDTRRLSAQLNGFFELSPDLMALAGLEGYFKRLSSSWESALGYRREELLTHPWLHFIHPDDQRKTNEAAQRLAQGERVELFLNRYRHADGSYRWIEWHAAASAHDGLIHCVARDVTDRKQGEEARERHLDHLRFLLDLSRSVLQETQTPRLMQHIVDAAENLTGARMGICGHGFRDGVFEVGASSTRRGRPACPPGTVFKVERGGVYEELLTKYSTIRYSQSELLEHPDWWGLPEGHAPLNGLLGARLVGTDERPIGLIMVSDKAEGEFTLEDEALLAQVAALASLGMQHLKARDEALRQASQLNAAFAAMNEAVLVYDLKGIPSRANRSALESFGFDPVGMQRSELIRRLRMRHPDGRDFRVCELPCTQALRRQPVRDLRMHIRGQQAEERVVLASSAPLLVDGVVIGAVCVWHDVTERERLLTELEERVRARTETLRDTVTQLRKEITARQKTEASLQESEERYRTLFRAAPVGLLMTSTSGRVLDANEAACSILGCDRDKLMQGANAGFFAKPSQRSRLLSEVRRSGDASDNNLLLLRRDGSQFIGSLAMSEVQFRGNRLLLSILQDLTKQRQAERHNQGVARLLEFFAATHSLDEYLKSVIEWLNEWTGCRGGGIRMLAQDGSLPYACSQGFSRRFLSLETRLSSENPTCACLMALRTGSSGSKRRNPSFFCNRMSQFVEQHFAVDDDRQALPCVKFGYESVAHVPILHHNRLLGAIHLADRKPQRFPAEAVVFIEAAARVVGEALHRFQIEDQLRDSEQRFRSMFEAHDAVMLLIEPESGLIEDANQAAATFYGYPRSKLRGMRIDTVSPLPDWDLRTESSREPSRSRVQTHRLASEETRMVEVHSSTIVIGARPLIFAIIHDVTERQLLEKQVLKISDEERQRVGRDLHDSLGGSLTGIALMSQSLAQRLERTDLPDAEIAGEIVEAVNQAISHSRSIARNLCPISEGTEGFASGLRDFLHSVSRHSKVQCRLFIDESAALEDDLIASHLFRITQEAVNNAIRHGKARQIRVELRATADDLVLRIRDDGIGIRLPVPSKRGLGLRTMRHRADVIGARLEFRQGARGGTVVTCRLPWRATSGDARVEAGNEPGSHGE